VTLSSVLATPPHLLTAAIVASGGWLLWPGTGWFQKLLGLGLLAVAWAVRPTAPDRDAPPAAGGLAVRYVRAAVHTLRRWEEMLSPYRPDLKIGAEHQVLLTASGGGRVLSHSAQSGLIADVVSLLMLPFRLLATAYRRLLERWLPERPERPEGLDPSLSGATRRRGRGRRPASTR
jgi:hypothetical protein